MRTSASILAFIPALTLFASHAKAKSCSDPVRTSVTPTWYSPGATAP